MRKILIFIIGALKFSYCDFMKNNITVVNINKSQNNITKESLNNIAFNQLKSKSDYLNISNRNNLILFCISFIYFSMFYKLLKKEINEKIEEDSLTNNDITFFQHPLLYLFPLIPIIIILIIKLFDYKTIKSLNNKMYFLSYYGLEILYLLIFSILFGFKILNILKGYTDRYNQNKYYKMNEINLYYVYSLLVGMIAYTTINNIINGALLKKLFLPNINDIIFNNNNNYLSKINNSMFVMNVILSLNFILNLLHFIAGKEEDECKLLDVIDIEFLVQIIFIITIIFLSIRTFNDIKFFKALEANNPINLKKYWLFLIIINSSIIIIEFLSFFNCFNNNLDSFNINEYEQINDYISLNIFGLCLPTIINNFIISGLYNNNIKILEINNKKN